MNRSKLASGNPMNRIAIIQSDITTQHVDAIVNAANNQLRGGGGVDGAIHRAAGPELLEACRAIGGCPTGQARITPGFRLPAKWVIHTVGPVWQGGRSGEAAALASCYQASLRLAREYGCRTIAFPAISCGVFGYPLLDAARIAIEATSEFLAAHELPANVTWVLFGEETFLAWQEAVLP